MELPKAIRNYPGNKGMQGLTEKIINQIPPHDVYVERFGGSAAIWRAKRPALLSVLNELDAAVCRCLAEVAEFVYNDGFDDAEDFAEWWIAKIPRQSRKPNTIITWEGCLHHWTDFRY